MLVNNAGVFIPKAFTEYTTEDLDTFVSTHARGLSLRVTARRKANVETEIRQHRQHLNDTG